MSSAGWAAAFSFFIVMLFWVVMVTDHSPANIQIMAWRQNTHR